MQLKTPETIKAEHEELHVTLHGAMHEPGAVGDAAKEVARVMHPHFLKEEEYAMPPLGLLSELARGETAPDMARALTLTDKLKAEMPQMLEEHKHIVAALQKLAVAAEQDGKPQYVDFAKKLMLHAKNEEEVLYPAALLVGEIVRIRLGL